MNNPEQFYYPPTPPKPSKAPKESDSPFMEVVRFTLFALLIVIPIRLFIIQPFIVSGTSMVPTFQNGEYLVVDQISYKFSDPARGDVVVFQFPLDPSRFFIKRIIGLPGETIKFHDGQVTIVNGEHPLGFTLDEPYINDPVRNEQEITLDQHEYFVMGDNRGASSDSRLWGPLEEDFLIGRAWIRLLPPKSTTYLPGDYRGTYQSELLPENNK